MTIVKTARWWIQKYAPQNFNKFDISAVSFDIKFSCGIEDSRHQIYIYTVVCKSLGTPLRLHDNFLSSPKKINIIL